MSNLKKATVFAKQAPKTAFFIVILEFGSKERQNCNSCLRAKEETENGINKTVDIVKGQ